MIRHVFLLAAAAAAALGVGGTATAQKSEELPALRRAPALCLSEAERSSALKVGLVSLAPAPLCAPSYQVVEVRNDSASPISNARLFLSPPLGEGEMSFAPLPGAENGERRYVEYSLDEGASWLLAEAPVGSGTLDDPLEFSSAQIPALRRLGAAGESDDSILVRWRARLGEKFGEPFAGDALLGLSGSARDACARPIRAEQRLSRLSLDRPALIAGLEGRNVSRGGAFARAVRAAPGDEIEWRMALENIGEAPAAIARAELWEEGRRKESREVLALDGVVSGARRTATKRMKAGEGCVARTFRLSPSWGCAAPAAGAPAALAPLGEGYSVARILREPDPNAIVMSLKMTGEDGSPRPGDRAVVVAEIRNDGPPAFAPRVLVTLPDGYAPRRDRPIEMFATDSGVANARWATAEEERAEELDDDQALIILIGAPEAEATLDPDAFVELRLGAQRVRRSARDSARLSARTLFLSACDEPGRSRPARLRVEPRQSDLTASLTALDPPIVSEPGTRMRFRATIANSGEEAAERLTATLQMGRSWSVDTPAPENCKPEGDPEARRFVCTVAGAARPGSSVSFDFDALAGPEAAPPDESLLEQAAAALDGAGGADFSIALNVEAYRAQEATGAAERGGATENPIAEARAEIGAIGFRLRQKILDENGSVWPPDRPIDLGDEVLIEVEAQWWGAGRERISEPTLIQTLPRTLSIQSASGEQDGVAVGAAVRSASKQVLWGLRSMEGGGRFVGRIAAVAVDAGAKAGPSKGASFDAESGWDSAEADAVFVLRDRTYGVDALASTATSATPLNRLFRKPDLRVALRLDPSDAAPLRDRASDEGRNPVIAGGRATAALTLANAGGGPAYVDWIELSTPPSLQIEPLGSDGLDNDGDGRIDEGDESEFALRRDADGVSRLRWIRLPDGGARRIGEGRSRLAPGAGARLPLAFRIDENAAPGVPLNIAYKVQFGARPFARRQATGRAEIAAGALVTPLPVSGALALTETRAATADPRTPPRLELRRKIRHGERVEHRAILQLPPGSHRRARFNVYLPPALADSRARALRFGLGVTCEGAEDARLEPAPAEAGEKAATLIWPLGDCKVDPEAPIEARTLIMDVVSVAKDAEPEQEPAARAVWRRAVARSWLERGGAEEDARERYPLGRSELSLSGPLLSARIVSLAGTGRSVASAGRSNEGGLFDAGDRFEAVIEALNSGDVAAKSVALQVKAPTGRAASTSDCRTLRIEAERDGAFHKGGADCGGIAVLNAPLKAGGTARFKIKGVLRPDAPIGAESQFNLALSGLGEAAISARAAAASLKLPIRGAEPPLLRSASTLAGQSAADRGASNRRPQAGDAQGDKEGAPDLAIGAPLLVSATHFAPEGAGDASLVFRMRVVDADGAGAPGALEGLRLVEASVARMHGRLILGADPGRLNDSPLGERSAITGAIEQTTDSDGWRRFTLPLGRISRDAVTDGRSDAKIEFEAVAVLQDTEALQAGLRLEVEALTAIQGAPPARRRITAARLAEPSLTVAVRAIGQEGVVRLGEAAQFSADICNVGAAPAYGVIVEGLLPAGFRLDPTEAPRFTLAPRQPKLEVAPSTDAIAIETADAPAGFGTVEVSSAGDPEEGARLVARTAPAAGVSPGRCARVVVSARAARGGWQSLSTARFAVASYASRPGDGDAGRRYLGGPAGGSALQTFAISVDALPEAEVDAGGVAIRKFDLSVEQSVEPLLASASVEASDELSWALFLDANGDGVLDGSDPPWRDGAQLERGGRTTIFAVARIPSKIGPRWRRSARLRVTALGASGRIAAGQAEFSVRAREERLGALEASRVMAVDRDCDGDLADETAQDAAFEAAKDAAPGECLAMRIFFRNAGAAAVESVSIEDSPPSGLIYEPGAARVVVTPNGLIGGQVTEPSPASAGADQGAKRRVLRFDFVGALAPGDGGVVEYRLRLPSQ